MPNWGFWGNLGPWRAMGLECTYIVHIIPEFAEQDCTATLYMHRWSHTWFNPRTGMLFSDEAGERDLRGNLCTTRALRATFRLCSPRRAPKHTPWKRP